MLKGEAVVAIWNDLASETEAPGARATFYAWHLHEHMPERVAIPGFRRGCRYIAESPATHPEFFTLYEADTLQVLQGPSYLARLDAPTTWTRAATSNFRNTARALAQVLLSTGPGPGGTLLTLRFDAPCTAPTALRTLILQTAEAPRITGAHLCRADPSASGRGTAETAGRTDIQQPPKWFALIEATNPEGLATLLPDTELLAAGATGPILRGIYRLEHLHA